MKKKVWIVNYYNSVKNNVSNPRYLEFAQYFQKSGYEVTSINASFTEKINNERFNGSVFLRERYENLDFIHVKTPHYVGNGLKRIYSIFIFAWRLLVHRNKYEKPDIILHNLHTPFDYPIFWLARIWKVRYVAEAWDLWPDNFITFGLISAKNPFMKIAYWMEKHLYEKADEIVFTQEGAIDYLRNKHWTIDTGGKIDLKKVNYINNGVNLDKFDEDCKSFQRNDTDLNDPNTYKIIYLGSIRLANDLKKLIDAAVLLKNNFRYKFLIYGDGIGRDYLEKYVYDNNIHNVIFKEKWIPICEVAYVVSQATVNIMNYQKNFGIHGVSSGKMFQYMAAGKPICCNIKLNFSEISRNNLGIDEELNTPQQYATAIKTLAEQNPIEYAAMCERVRACAERFDYKKLAEKEMSVVNNLFS